MLLYYLFWMFNGLYYANCHFLPISVFRRKGISNGIQTEWNLRESYFWNKRNPGDLERTSRSSQGGHEAGGRAQGVGAPPTLVAPPTYFFRLHILIYLENIQEHHKTLFPLPQPSIPGRSHLGAFSGAPPEGESIMEGFYINTIASPMMCE